MLSITATGEGLESLLKRNEHLEILRYIRSHRLGQPELVLKHGRILVGKHLSGQSTLVLPHSVSNVLAMLGLTLKENEVLTIMEQMLRAALELGQHDLADQCYSQIVARVNNPDSSRVRFLLGLCLEASGDIEGASKIYDELLKDNPVNMLARKRKYCIIKARGEGHEGEAMQALNACLQHGNSSDAPTWFEMAELCSTVGDVKGAIFCYEELLLMDPLNSQLHLEIGKLYAKDGGGLSNLKFARKHLAQSLELSPQNNAEALVSLLEVSSSFVSEANVLLQKNSNKTRTSRSQDDAAVDEDDVEVAKALMKYSADNLLAQHKGTPKFSTIETMVNKHLASLS